MSDIKARDHLGTAVVTGAGGGLGRAIAVRLATDGFVIAALDDLPLFQHNDSVRLRHSG